MHRGLLANGTVSLVRALDSIDHAAAVDGGEWHLERDPPERVVLWQFLGLRGEVDVHEHGAKSLFGVRR
jgi:hypothetical protein